MTKLNLNSIIVIGAGPAAAALCMRLHEKGHKVTVIIEGALSPLSYSERVSKIDNASEIWKLSDTQDDVSVQLSEYQNFYHISIHGAGGLSSRWGGGVAKLSHLDMNISKKIAAEIENYHDFAEIMIGTNDNTDDPVAEYVGLFRSSWDKLGKQGHYTRLRRSTSNVVFGQSIQAINHINNLETSKKACNLCGHCSIFCGRGSFYNAQQNFLGLRQYHRIIQNTKVCNIKKITEGYEVYAISDGKEISLKADIVVMAAGPVNTYKILKQTLLKGMTQPASILNTPAIRGMAFSPFYQIRKIQLLLTQWRLLSLTHKKKQWFHLSMVLKFQYQIGLVFCLLKINLLQASFWLSENILWHI